jgi:hypothetical protein
VVIPDLSVNHLNPDSNVSSFLITNKNVSYSKVANYKST